MVAFLCSAGHALLSDSGDRASTDPVPFSTVSFGSIVGRTSQGAAGCTRLAFSLDSARSASSRARPRKRGRHLSKQHSRHRPKLAVLRSSADSKARRGPSSCSVPLGLAWLAAHSDIAVGCAQRAASGRGLQRNRRQQEGSWPVNLLQCTPCAACCRILECWRFQSPAQLCPQSVLEGCCSAASAGTLAEPGQAPASLQR